MSRFRILKIHHHLWKHESGLTTMLVLLGLIDFLIVPLWGSDPFVRLVVNFFWMVLLFAGIFSVVKNRRNALLIAILPVCYIIVRSIVVFHVHRHYVYLDFLFGLFTILMMIGMVLGRVFEPGKITVHRIVGSVVVYLLLGNLFSMIFEFIYHVNPSTFAIQFPSRDPNTIHAGFLYFSYTTLTTTGYGDILPVGLFTRSLVVVEQVIGVLYPVVLIGRLVSVKIERD